jgi:hypothetical protein
VHPQHDEEENCVQSAGKKQRGSFNSLLLLEAHELSMHEVRPRGGEGREGGVFSVQ